MTEAELQKEAERVWREAVEAFLRSNTKHLCAIAVIATALRKIGGQRISPTYHGICSHCGQFVELQR